jgi:phage terminase large subunit-like protein
MTMHPDYVTAYAQAIRDGKVAVCRKTATIYARLADEIAHPDPEGQWTFDQEKAERPIQFIERFCKHSKGEWAGKAVRLELWQKAFISALFGFVDRKTGLRRYREAFLEVGRKNGKSLLLSGIGAYMLIGDHEPGAEVYTVATKLDQARIVFEEAHRMVAQSPALSSVIKKRRSDLYCPSTMSRLAALGKNSNTLDGLNSSCVIIDELHGIRDRNLYEVMKQSMSARRQPLLIMITTAGTVRECIFDDVYDYACNVLDGTFTDERFLPVIYELDSKAEWKDPDAWAKANPNLGVSKKVEDLKEKVEQARQDPKSIPGLLCKDFDMRQTSTSAWLTFEDIDNSAKFDIERFRGSYAVGGADLSRTTDLTCATLLMCDSEGGTYATQMYWLPEDNVEKRVKEDKIPYDIWHEMGLVRYCKGNSIAYSDVTAWFVEMTEKAGITPAWIYYDPYSARYWVDEMESAGFEMVRCYQGAKTLSLPMQQLGQDLKAHKVNYNDSPILKWCITNTGVETDRNDNIIPKKAGSPKQRIDGLASLLDAYVGYMDHKSELAGLAQDFEKHHRDSSQDAAAKE